MSGGSGDRRLIALLGRWDEPTDGVVNYCSWLGRALEARGWTLEPARVPWAQRGWMASLRWLRQQRSGWRGRWVIVQYTALTWSRWGFPFGFLAVLHELRRGGTRCAIVFHDPTAYGGQRLVDRLRRACQHWVMRRAYRWANLSILTIPLEKAPWLPARPDKAVFIPVGAILPEPRASANAAEPAAHTEKTVAVYGVTGGEHTPREAGDIAYAVNRATQHGPEIRLVVFGRGSEDAGEALAGSLRGARVHLSVLGVLPTEEISRILSAADALLFVRGHISTRRSSAIAGIACGLPVVGYSGPETGFPITEAGVALVPQGDREALAQALTRVLGEDAWRWELRERSQRAHGEHFSWNAIAERYIGVLGDVRRHPR